MSEGVG